MPLVTTFDLDLDSAWSRSVRRAHRAEVPDVLRWEDHKLAWSGWRDMVIEAIDSGEYQPSQPMIVEVPKDGFAVRPFAALNPVDHAVYEAVVASLAPFIDAALPPTDTLFSSRFTIPNPGTYRLQDQPRAWAQWQGAARDLYNEYESAFMLKTDVASYFEYIHLGTLVKDLKSLTEVPVENVDLLSRILNGFERNSDVWGLPQGPEASGILGNLYLLAVDRSLEGQPVRALRFQDDLMVFADRPEHLRSALREIIRVMRNRHLNISLTKTKLLSGLEILQEIEDAEKDAIQYGLRVNDDGALVRLRDLFDNAVAQDPINARDVRFAVYRLQQQADPHAIPWILDNLAEAPYVAALLVEYLSSHLADRPEIEQSVIDFLGDPSRNIYPYVEMQLIRMLGNAPAVTDEALATINNIALDANRDGYVREHAVRSAGRHARAGDAGSLLTQFNQSTDYRIRRALLVAITEASGIDKGWLQEIAKADAQLAHTAEFLRRGAALPNP